MSHLSQPDVPVTRPMNVAYILLRFPYLTETFIAEEIRAIQSKGIRVKIVSLLKPDPGPVQPHSQELLPFTWHAPGLMSSALWKAQLWFLFRTSRLYFALLVTLLRRPYKKQPLSSLAKRVMIFLKAVAVAYQLKGSEVQLLHAHFAWLSGAAAWICARLLDIPFTVTVHAYDIFASTDLLGLICGEASQVIAISNHNLQALAAADLRSPEQITVIRCGVNLDEFEVHRGGNESSSSNGRVEILSVGSLVEKKGHRFLIEACGLLQERGIDFACTIIGGGPQKRELHRLVKRLGLSGRVRLLGARPHPEILAAYPRHHLFVLASIIAKDGDRDGIPVVMMEAGAMGLPIVSTEVSGIPEIVRRDQTGVLVPPGDAAALAEAIADLAIKPQVRRQLGENTRALIEAEFNIARNTSRLANIWSETLPLGTNTTPA